MLAPVLTDANLQHFAHVFRAHPDAVVTPSRLAAGGTEVERLLGLVGGWALGDFRFLLPGELAPHRQQWAERAEAFEAGRSTELAHAHWSPAWTPLAATAREQWAWDPAGCFGGSPGQVVCFDVRGEGWDVYASLAAWVRAFSVGLRDEDVLGGTRDWAEKNGVLVRVALPSGEARRSAARFEAGATAWIELVHPDGTRWAIREERAGYTVRVGDPADPLIRHRECERPREEVARLVAEQHAAGFRGDLR